MTPRLVSAGDFPREPDPVVTWIRLDRLTRRVSAGAGAWSRSRRRRSRLMVLRAWTARTASYFPVQK
jgi:hypothetical protein